MQHHFAVTTVVYCINMTVLPASMIGDCPGMGEAINWNASEAVVSIVCGL
jgi:hypothetical protein